MIAEPSDAETATAEERHAREQGRLLFALDCTFILAAADLKQVPTLGLPEIAFAGRSNVGKSSLVNALTGRKTLARTSNTPGRTQQLIFFNLGDRLMLTDLPGYGYARASKEQIRQWTKLTRDYLRGRQALRRICVLIDSRHGIKDTDRKVMDLLDEAAVSYQAVLTKADKVKAKDLAAVITATEKSLAQHVAAHPRIIVTSAQKNLGIESLRGELAGLALPAAER